MCFEEDVSFVLFSILEKEEDSLAGLKKRIRVENKVK